MSLNREDVLRELELLPVWQLRSPAIASVATIEKAPEPMPEKAEAQLALRMILSEDSNFLFLLAPLQSNEEETLLQNMLKAMHVKTRIDTGLQRISDLSAQQAKIIIAMGEVATQAIGLGGNSHAASGAIAQTAFGAAIATFSPAHLLANSADKARAWHDLCLAKAHVKNLT